MDERMLDRVERKVDVLLDRTKNVESDHAEIIALRKRMHSVEGAQGVFRNILDAFDDLRGSLNDLDKRVVKVENNQVTAEAVKEALSEHEERMETKRDRRDRRVFAVLGLLASVGGLNLIINLLQGSSPSIP